MSLLFGRSERRSISYQDVFGTGGNWADSIGTGIESGARLAPVFSAWRLIAGIFASTPLVGYRQTADGVRQRMASQPMLLAKPDPWGRTCFAWKHQMILSLLSRGNAYGLVTSVDSAGWPTAIWWLQPDLVSVFEQPGERPRYFYEAREIPSWTWARSSGSIVHIGWMVPPGKWKALSPLEVFKATIETGYSAQITARDTYKNGAIPPAHFKNVGKTLDPDEADLIKTRFMSTVADRSPLVTGSDWDIKTLALPPDQAQFIESQRMTATQIASVYGVPPEKIGGEVGGKSLHYTTRESNQADLVTFTMMEWFVRIEEQLTALMPRPIDAAFDLDVLLRADLMTRMNAHSVAVASGVETIDEARHNEGRAPLTPEELAFFTSMHLKGLTAGGSGGSTNTDPTSARLLENER